MSLDQFFSAMGPFLRGEQDIDTLNEELGPSESGPEAMTFYATLVRRNYGKILREVFVSVMRASRQLSPDLWPQLVREYAARTRVMHHDPNEFGREFPEWLASRQAQHPEQPASLAELADYQWIRHAARHAPRSEELGLDQRLFVRHYTHAIPKLAAALWREEQVDLDSPQPTSVLVYREHEGQKLRCFYPTAMGLGIVIERASGCWPEALSALENDTESRDAAEQKLIEHGVLPCR